MNICYINPTNNIRRPIAELANIFSREGHNITIMYPTSKACPTKNWIANDLIHQDNITPIPIPSWYFSPLRYSLPNIFRLITETKKAYAHNDIIHIWEYFYPLSIIPLLYAKLARKRLAQKRRGKTILTTDGFVGYSYQPKEPWWLVPSFKAYTSVIARFLFKIPRKITTYGSSMAPFAHKAGIPRHLLIIIPTGLHLEKFQADTSTIDAAVKTLRNDLGIKKEKVILFAGMLTERKGVDKVIKISLALLREGLPIKTIIVGDAHGPNPYPALVPEQYKKDIIFTGGRKDIPEFMQLADVLLLPSEGEGLLGVVMEAMASGLPVVATKEGCTPDLIDHGKNGFLVDNGNYIQPVKELLASAKKRQSFSAAAKEKIQQFSWIQVAPKYLSLYQEGYNDRSPECRNPLPSILENKKNQEDVKQWP